jgi:hypothetical protein
MLVKNVNSAPQATPPSQLTRLSQTLVNPLSQLTALAPEQNLRLLMSKSHILRQPDCLMKCCS